ncbi:MAG TPA: DmsC/YnfH family molybdoenzyme membrane anchor subunit [Iamia sp.]
MTDLLTPLDGWLNVQQDLSAVERFSQAHDVGLGVERYRDRLPATPPGPGQQYGFEVDLDACTGCKACVAACHSLNGLEEDETWRKVGALHAGVDGAVEARGSVTVTSACHHCVEPACMDGCPANAYEKDPVTGIVRHLDDACIGCSYCTLTCPYEVPTYQPSLGIVRKCDMCSDRLAEGEAPACVQGCPQGAITIALVDTAELVASVRVAEPPRLVPSAPTSDLTVPTTRYRSTVPVPESWVATDRSSIHPSAGHAPLALMLVLTQVAVGMTVAAGWIARSPSVGHAGADALGLAGLATGLVALAASTLHLGRPLLAWRAVLGLRRSWLSREIVAFGAFAAGGAGRFVADLAGAPAWIETTAGAVGVIGGLAGVACSAQLYAVTGRRWWRLPATTARFGGTALLGGACGSAAVLALADPTAARPLVPSLLAVAAVGLALSVLGPLVPLWVDAHRSDPSPDLAATARLLTHDLRDRHLVRLATAGVTALLLAGAAAAPGESGIVLAVAGLVVLVGEHQDRRLFFLASVAPRMPGSPR